MKSLSLIRRNTISLLRACWTLQLLILCLLATESQAESELALVATNLFGGSGNQRATGVSIAGESLVFAGTTDANGGDGLAASLTLPLSNGTAVAWSLTWPGLAGSDELAAVASSTDAVYTVGYSYGRTTDTAGGKESKGITVKFPTDGATGAGYGGAVWDVQTPAPPGAFSYGGGESLRGCVLAQESGIPYLYATGSGQAGWSNGGRMFLSKLNAAGTILWTRTDASSMVANAYSAGLAMCALNGYVYVAGQNNDTGSKAYLCKYDADGNLKWLRRAASGHYAGVTTLNGAIYAVGMQGSGAAGDFLVDKWNESGTLDWSRSIDRNATEDGLKGVVALDGRIFAAGYTYGDTAGGADAIVLEIDPVDGELLATRLFGGEEDDKANGIATDGTDIYAVGETKSFAAGGNIVGQNDAFVLRYIVGLNTVLLDVESDHGTPDPSVGNHSYVINSAVTCSVDSVVSEGGTNYTCTGWTGTGSIPATGTSHSTGAIILTNAESSIIWNWEIIAYWLEAATIGNGSIIPSTNWYAAGTNLALAAVPDSGWLFMGWSGDLAGDYTASNTTLLVDGAKSIVATFSNDADADGILNTNEWDIGTDPRNSDTDGDGFDDGFEVAENLSPTNDSSSVISYIMNNQSTFGLYTEEQLGVLALGSLMIQSSNAEIHVDLQLMKSDDLITWTNAGDAIWWSMPAGNKEFYKVRAQP